MALLMITACADDENSPPPGSADETTPTEPDTDESVSSTDGGEPTTSGTEEPDPDPEPDPDADPDPDLADLPGEEWDGFASPGDELAVMGVAHDDELNVRALPNASSDIVSSVGPTESGLVATGRARRLPQSLWYEVEVGGEIGWVSASFVGFMAGTDDATSEYVLIGSEAQAETMVDLARVVSEAFASEEPASRIVQSVAPTVGDLGQITYDVIGLGDDSVAGLRLHILATPDENNEKFTLKTIERTLFCNRGTDGELCL